MDFKKPVTLSQIFIYFFTGFGAGIAGTAVLAIIIFLSWTVIGGVLSPQEVPLNEFGVQINENPNHPLFLHFVVLAVFLGAMVANLANVLLSTIIHKGYKHRSTLLTQTFFGNLIVLMFMLPTYIVASSVFDNVGIGAAAMLHAIFSMLFTFFVLEGLKKTQHFMVSVYGAILGLTLFTFFGVLLAKNTSALLFTTLPLFIGFLGLGNGIAQSVYSWIYRSYGSDFLNSETRFGEDYGQDEESTQTVAPQPYVAPIQTPVAAPIQKQAIIPIQPQAPIAPKPAIPVAPAPIVPPIQTQQ